MGPYILSVSVLQGCTSNPTLLQPGASAMLTLTPVEDLSAALHLRLISGELTEKDCHDAVHPLARNLVRRRSSLSWPKPKTPNTAVLECSLLEAAVEIPCWNGLRVQTSLAASTSPENELPHRAPRQLRARSGTNDAPPGNQAIYNSSRPSGALVFRTVTCWMSKRQGLQKPGRNKTLLVKHFFQMHTRVLEG